MFFSANDHEASDPDRPKFTLIPEGWQTAIITESDVSTSTKSPDAGEMLIVEFTIADGEYDGKTLKMWLCINHKKDVPRNIANGNLAAICQSCGRIDLDAPDDLLNAEVDIKIGVKQPEPGDRYGPSNTIEGFAPPGSRTKNTAPAPRQAAAASGPRRQSWKK